jgi:hypothetical protein
MISRRSVLKGAAAGLGSALLPLGCATRRSPLIVEENAKPGTSDWILTNTRAVQKCRCPWVEGYCSKTSLRAGETLEIKVSTNPESPFVIDLYRMGYYGGKGGRFMARLGPFKGTVQPDPEPGDERVRACSWETSAKLAIPSDWPSGVYLGKLTEEKEKLQSYVVFVVRDDRPCDFLFQVSDTTWAAYNRWPDLWSLYDDGTPPHNWYTGPGVRVSFDRPYGKYRQILDAPLSQGSGEFLLWEFPLDYWMEAQGYDVSYISNVDTHADGPGLRRGRAFLSIAHDEYWSLDMFHHAKAAIDGGQHAAFLSGNAVDGLIKFTRNNRDLARVGKFGHFENEKRRYQGWTTDGPNPATLMGARSTSPYNGSADWTCVKDDHWLFAGTGMKNGDSIPSLVGWEHHGLPDALPGMEVLARGPVFSGKKAQNVEYTATLHPGKKGNLVFNAATIWWSLGLSEPPGFLRPSAHGSALQGPDPRVQRMTRSLFDRFLA